MSEEPDVDETEEEESEGNPLEQVEQNEDDDFEPEE